MVLCRCCVCDSPHFSTACSNTTRRISQNGHVPCCACVVRITQLGLLRFVDLSVDVLTHYSGSTGYWVAYKHSFYEGLKIRRRFTTLRDLA